MSSAVKSIKSSDLSTIPYKVNKQFTFESASLYQNGIVGYKGYLETGSSLDEINDQQLIYYSIRQLYYGGDITSSLLIDNTSGSHYDNYQQSTAASGTFEYEIKKFPTNNRSEIRVLSIPQSLYGERVNPSTLILASTSSVYYIVDDGNGNLFDIESLPEPYVVNGEIQKDYFSNVNKNTLPKVGNIFYAHGILTITNEDYLYIIPKDCTLTGGYAYYIPPSPTPSISISPSSTPSVSVTPSVTITPTPSISLSFGITPTPTPSISISPSETPSVSVTPTPSISETPSVSVTPSISITPSITPSTSTLVAYQYGLYGYGDSTGEACNQSGTGWVSFVSPPLQVFATSPTPDGVTKFYNDNTLLVEFDDAAAYNKYLSYSLASDSGNLYSGYYSNTLVISGQTDCVL